MSNQVWFISKETPSSLPLSINLTEKLYAPWCLLFGKICCKWIIYCHHSTDATDLKDTGKKSLKSFHLFMETIILACYLSTDAMVLGGLCRYCLNCSSKAWPMVLMTLWAKPSEHSRMWHAEEDKKEKFFFPLNLTIFKFIEKIFCFHLLHKLC